MLFFVLRDFRPRKSHFSGAIKYFFLVRMSARRISSLITISCSILDSCFLCRKKWSRSNHFVSYATASGLALCSHLMSFEKFWLAEFTFEPSNSPLVFLRKSYALTCLTAYSNSSRFYSLYT